MCEKRKQSYISTRNNESNLEAVIYIKVNEGKEVDKHK